MKTPLLSQALVQVVDAVCRQLTRTALVAAHYCYQVKDSGFVSPEAVADARTVSKALDSSGLLAFVEWHLSSYLCQLVALFYVRSCRSCSILFSVSDAG